MRPTRPQAHLQRDTQFEHIRAGVSRTMQGIPGEEARSRPQGLRIHQLSQIAYVLRVGAAAGMAAGLGVRCWPLLRKGSTQVGATAIDGRLQIDFAMGLVLNGCKAPCPVPPHKWHVFKWMGWQDGSVPVGASRHAHTEFSVFSVKRNVLLQAGQRHPSTEPPMCVQSLV